MTANTYDIAVVGGGIHGTGVAQAASAAGYRVLLIEQTALASGTSGRSSKLVHGGLRYLESGQLRLVYESLHERSRLLALAPDLVRLTPFYIPIYRDTARRPWTVGLGLSLYAMLGGFTRGTRFTMVSRRVWGDLDGLRTDGLQAVWRYQDAQTDDVALTRAVARSAIQLGAELACPAEFLSARPTDDGYRLIIRNAGADKEIFCRVIVNAAGPWVDSVAQRVHPAVPRLAMELVQGTHAIFPGQLTRGVYYVEAPQDRRAVFVMPWHEGTLVGTTETSYTGDPAQVRPLPEEFTYLQETVRYYFPRRSLDIIDGFSGLRVLPRGDTRLFRRPRGTLFLQEPGAGRYVAIYGGKLTGYRSAGAQVMKLLRSVLPPAMVIADPANIPLQPD